MVAKGYLLELGKEAAKPSKRAYPRCSILFFICFTFFSFLTVLVFTWILLFKFPLSCGGN